jgi:hypothetical protein
MKTFTFNAEDIFEEIPEDPDHVLMKFPPELLEAAGWKEGDTLNIELKDGSILINKV